MISLAGSEENHTVLRFLPSSSVIAAIYTSEMALRHVFINPLPPDYSDSEEGGSVRSDESTAYSDNNNPAYVGAYLNRHRRRNEGGRYNYTTSSSAIAFLLSIIICKACSVEMRR